MLVKKFFLNNLKFLFKRHGFEPGRYRLEAVLHGQKIFTFGGGAPDFCAEFNEVRQIF